MKSLLSFLLAAAMVFPFAACGIVNSSGNEPPAPPEGWAAEYTILIGGSGKWTPYTGKSGATFSNSDNKVIGVSSDGATIKFTGKKVGASVITATLDGAEKKAIVRVRAVESGAVEPGEDLLKWVSPESLYVKYVGDPDSLAPEVPDEKYYTGKGKEILIIGHTSEFGLYYHDNPLRISYFGPGSSDHYECDDNGNEWFWYGPSDFEWSHKDKAYYSLFIGRMAIDESSEHAPGGDLFFPLNAFASNVFRFYAPAPRRSNYLSVAEYRTGQHETILGVNCDVFKIKDITFYVDPKTHYTLKTVWPDGKVTKVLEYDANYSGGVPYKPGQKISVK